MLFREILRPSVVVFDEDAPSADRVSRLLLPIADVILAYHFDEAVAACEASPEVLLVCPAGHAERARASLPTVKLVTHSAATELAADGQRLHVPGVRELAAAVTRLFRY
ncbi:MAG: hypothetical protein R3B13_01985 [Polyangiaceae bacterium]